MKLQGLRLFLFVILFGLSTWADQRIQGDCMVGGTKANVGGLLSINSLMGSFPSCTVSVFTTGTTNLVAIYSDNNRTPLGNPFTADSKGHWFFYLPTSVRVDIQLSGSGISPPFVLGDVESNDPAGASVAIVNPGAPGTTTGGIQEAITVLGVAGGTVAIPCGVYQLTSSISVPSTRALTLQGCGWQTAVVAAFGSSQWLAANAIRGTVLQVGGSNDAIDYTGTTGNPEFNIRDLAILGPGTGTAVGINFLGTSQSYNYIDNVLIANFNIGMEVQNAVTNRFGYVATRGCTTGFTITGAVDDLDINRLEAQADGTAWNQLAGGGIRIRSGLVQSNTNGMLIAPLTASIANLTIRQVWLEANTNYGIKFDTTSFPITDVQVEDSRCSSAGDTVLFTGGNSLGRVTFHNDGFACAAVTVPAVANAMVFDNTNWASVTYASNAKAVEIGGRFNGQMKLGVGVPLLGGEFGQGLIDGDNSGNINIGRHGSANVNNTNILGNNVVFFDPTVSTQRLTVGTTITMQVPMTQNSVTFSNLGTPANGTLNYCSDCTVANPCAGSGSGALAKRINGAWVCN